MTVHSPNHWTFRVEGSPAPKGNARAYTYKRKDGGVGARVEMSGSKAHERNVRLSGLEARPQWVADYILRNIDFGCRLDVAFILPAPKWVSARRRKTRKRPAMEPHHTKRPDADKLLRTVKDGLTGVAYRDDSQVATGSWAKRYAMEGETPHTSVTVTYFEAEFPVLEGLL